jgi:hypothetical protein
LVCPEDCPVVLGNFHTALKAGGLLYFTVELADLAETKAAFEAGKAQGLPIVFGEWALEGGYHYYPASEQVREWLQVAKFEALEETVGDEYHHFIVKKSA